MRPTAKLLRAQIEVAEPDVSNTEIDVLIELLLQMKLKRSLQLTNKWPYSNEQDQMR